MLLAAHSPHVLLAGSALTGLALAPLFPLILSLFLGEIGGSRNAGWVFAVAGLGGAVLSWLTGTVSSATGSLRIGLMVPGAAALLMMALITWRRNNQQGPTTGNQQETVLQPTATGKTEDFSGPARLELPRAVGQALACERDHILALRS